MTASPQETDQPIDGSAGSHVAPTREIATTLRTLFRPDDVFEIRIINVGGRKRTDSGYFSDPDRAAEGVVRLYDGRQPTIYVVLNPVPSDLLARASNRFKDFAELTTKDIEIRERRWLLLDVDPVRFTGISSTDAEHTASLELARTIRTTLVGEGWPAPILADSGNGGHLLFPVNLPCPDDLSRQRHKKLVEELLKDLADRFDMPEGVTPRCQLDRTVFNAARLTKLYGTAVRKGDALSDRPHRRSHLLDVPDELAPSPGWEAGS